MYILRFWENFKKFAVRITKPDQRGKLERYAFPLLLIATAFFIKTVLRSYLNLGTPYLMSTFIVVLSSWYGGLGAGISATILAGFLNNYLFLEPQFSFIGTGNAIATVIFLIQGFIISMISEAKRSSDKKKDEFIAFASHELKNPLTVMKMSNTLLQKMAKDIKNKKFTEYLVKTDSYIDKTTSLINELLDLTKIESGKLSLHKTTVDIDSLVREIVKDQQLITSTHKITVKGKTNKVIFADKIRIEQVLSNMITNAIKYSPGEKKVIVTIENKKTSVTISVQDFGIGLTEEEQKKVFERFYRATDTGAQGLGLGMYISQQVASLHGGKIWVKSLSGKGSTFYLQMKTG